MFKGLLAVCASLFEIQFGSESMRLARMYLPKGQYILGNREKGGVEPLAIDYSREKSAMIWKFPGAEIELVDDGSLRSFRANTLPPQKDSSRDAIEGLEVRSNSPTMSTYLHVAYDENEQPYFVQFETNGFTFQGWIKRGK